MKHVLIITLGWFILTPYINIAQVVRPHIEQTKPQNQYLIHLRNEIQRIDSFKGCYLVRLCDSCSFKMEPLKLILKGAGIIRYGKWYIPVMNDSLGIFFIEL